MWSTSYKRWIIVKMLTMLKNLFETGIEILVISLSCAIKMQYLGYVIRY